MKKVFAAVLRSALTLVFISALALVIISALTHSASPVAMVVDDCSCSAPDGSCSAAISCKGGCLHFCGNDGNCWASCSDDLEALRTGATIEMQNGTYPQLVAALMRISGKTLEFTPTQPDVKLNIRIKRAAVWDALEFLSDRGTLRVDGRDFESLRELRKVLLSGRRTSFSVKNIPVNRFVNDMAFLTGLPLRIIAGKPTTPVNIELRDVTLGDILKRVSKQTGVKIREDRT